METNKPLIRVFLVEDHAIVRVGLRTLLKQHKRLQVVGEAATCAEARREVGRLKPDVILMDLRLPDGTGIEVCRDILEEFPQCRVLFLTSFRDEDSMLAAVLAGASGYLLKEISPDKLVQAVEMVAEGHSILDQKAIQRVQAWVKNQETISFSINDWGLSPQQLRVFALVAEGKTNKEIAQDLGLSYKTVRNYLAAIFEKLKISRRSQAAAIFSKPTPKRESHMTPI